MPKDGSVKLKGTWFMRLYGPDSKLKQEVTHSYNAITSAGVSALALLLNNAASAAATNTFRYISIGTDSTAEATSNTVLGVEVGRHTGVVSYNASAIYEVVATFAAGSGTGAIVEYGLHNSNTAGDMMARDTEDVINKASGDTLEVTHQITLQPG